MEYRSDFIEREIQKIILLIRNLMANLGEEGNVNLKALDQELKEKLDFGFFEIFELSNEDLKKKINGVDVLILEELLRVLYKITIQNVTHLKSNTLKRVSLQIIDEIENKSSVYSFERQQIKNYFKSE
ncbi:MAG: hypothetical protein ABF250_08050 [Polaribacter sp.]|jgi:hypothetical protein|uniref:hypothetical protein n=2 Tax=Polaribacter sp. TaxID=1920175 RepID=UPI002623CCA9|nr:hypothetical protein [uncultured Polaribacter sp.]